MTMFPVKDDGKPFHVELARGEKKRLGTWQPDPSDLYKTADIFVLGLPAQACEGETPFVIPWRLLSTDRTRSALSPPKQCLQREYGTHTTIQVMTID